MFKYHTKCRACGSAALTPVFDLGLQPLANSFRHRDGEQDGLAPLQVLLCPSCSLAQLSVVVDPKILYADYAYETSKSETMRLHFRSLWYSICEESKAESVIEIGSNDGDFLAFARANGADFVCGIDPAENLARVANNRGIQTYNSILDEYSAACVSRVIPQADVIVARHVLAHVDDWQGFVRNLDTLANQDTLIAIEVPYVVDTLARVEFDTIYHEHLSYVSLKAVAVLLDATPFRIHKVMRFPVHGGSIAIFIRRRDSGIEPDVSVQEFLSAENITVDTWSDFGTAAFRRISNLARIVKSEGGNVCGFGASAKSTVWVSACRFGRNDIAFIVDNTPHKQGKFSPGTDIPILPESELEQADVAVCFAWNFLPEIEAKNEAWILQGGTFINPHDA